MPPKAATTKTTAKRSAPAEHPPYKEMIKEAILALKDRNGSSRPALKKYIKANYKGVDTDRFDSLFNQALKKGNDSNEFSFPKGPSGTVKLVKKEAAPKAKPASSTTKKSTTTKSTTKSATAKKPATKKTATAKPKATTTATKKTTTAAKPKANAKKPRKESAAAPAVVDKPTVLTKTKSGRVSKGTAPKPAATKKKAAPKKKATPKKTAATAAS